MQSQYLETWNYTDQLKFCYDESKLLDSIGITHMEQEIEKEFYNL
jgi:hypothetical protein